MRLIYNHNSFVVYVSEAEVQAFARRWPCFGPVERQWFAFDRRTGDLIDQRPNKGGGHERNDAAGIMALCDDAKAYGVGLGLMLS